MSAKYIVSISYPIDTPYFRSIKNDHFFPFTWTCIHALRWSRRAGRSAAAMAAACDFVEGSVHEFGLPDLDKAFQRMEAASVMIRELQDLRSPHRGAAPPIDATAIAKHL